MIWYFLPSCFGMCVVQKTDTEYKEILTNRHGEVELDFWGDFKCAHWGGVLCSVEGDRLPSPCVPGQAVRPQGGVVDL